MQPAIHVQRVVQSFGRKTPFKDMRQTVLNGINLTVAPGEIVCLLGPSGCGKTTLVDLVVGNTVPVSGRVEVLGEAAPYPTVRVRMGYMPQGTALYEDITAEENLRFFGSMYKMDARSVEPRMAELLKLMRLESDAKKLVSHFSGGMKQRLSLAVALLHDPDVIVLDEPTVGLDPMNRRDIWDYLETLSVAGKAILVTTHVMDEAERCKRVVLLHGGKVLADGSPAQVMEMAKAQSLEEAFMALEDAAELGVADQAGTLAEQDTADQAGTEAANA